MSTKAECPIGVFDSGIGGLTLVNEIRKVLPYEDIIYFGDLAHLPYGDKSTASIQSYAIKICNLLLEKNCKLIMIACNSASAAAYDLVREYVGSRAAVLNVVDPVVAYLKEKYPHKSIGLIGTKQTVFSNIYKKKVDELNVNIRLFSLATPLLVPMIEEGFCKGRITTGILHAYLSDPVLKDIDALILGCTHYPLIRPEIESYYQNKVTIIDSPVIIGNSVKHFLAEHKLETSSRFSNMRFYVSDYTPSFEESAKMFFPEAIQLEHYPLWE